MPNHFPVCSCIVLAFFFQCGLFVVINLFLLDALGSSAFFVGCCSDSAFVRMNTCKCVVAGHCQHVMDWLYNLLRMDRGPSASLQRCEVGQLVVEFRQI